MQKQIIVSKRGKAKRTPRDIIVVTKYRVGHDFVEKLGTLKGKKVELDIERFRFWTSEGAVPNKEARRAFEKAVRKRELDEAMYPERLVISVHVNHAENTEALRVANSAAAFVDYLGYEQEKESVSAL